MAKKRSPYSRTLYLVVEEDGAYCKHCKTRLEIKPKVRCANCVEREKKA